MTITSKDFTKERVALFTRYFIEDGRPITVAQLMKKAEDYCGFMPKRQTVYDDLNALDVAIGLNRENLREAGPGHRIVWSRPKK